MWLLMDVRTATVFTAEFESRESAQAAIDAESDGEWLVGFDAAIWDEREIQRRPTNAPLAGKS